MPSNNATDLSQKGAKRPPTRSSSRNSIKRQSSQSSISSHQTSQHSLKTPATRSGSKLTHQHSRSSLKVKPNNTRTGSFQSDHSFDEDKENELETARSSSEYGDKSDEQNASSGHTDADRSEDHAENEHETEHEEPDTEQEDVPLPDIRHVAPELFDSQDYLKQLNDLEMHLKSKAYDNITTDFPHEELTQMINAVSNTMISFRGYSSHSQEKMEAVRRRVKQIRDNMHRYIQAKSNEISFDLTEDTNELSPPGDEKLNLEEKQLQEKVALLNKELASTAEDMTKAHQVSLLTESEAIETAIRAQEALIQAKIIQDEYEARRQAEIEVRRAEEEKRQEEDRKREEMAKRQQEEQQKEEERTARLRNGGEESVAQAVWENWPVFPYQVAAGEFDQGVGCFVRASESGYSQSDFRCSVLDQNQAGFIYEENDELISNIIEITTLGDMELSELIFVAIPHCLSRTSAISREPVVKTEMNGHWQELPSQEVVIDAYKDLKLVQAEVSNPGKFVVVSRYKKDYLHLTKKGGKVTSVTDQRVTFTCPKSTFKEPEHFVIQIQPVDAATLTEVKSKPAFKELLTASAIVNMEWTSKEFKNPILMTLPCPPNPAKARKAAAARAAKEAKMNDPQLEMKENRQSETVRKANKLQATSKWYMGQYGLTDEDESEKQCLLRKRNGGKWYMEEDISVTDSRLDLVQFKLTSPLDRIMVLRVRPCTDPKDAVLMSTEIETQLSKRSAVTVLRQRSEDPCDVVMYVTPVSKLEKLLEQLNEEGYDDGPAPHHGVSLQEGDHIQIKFRGNLRVDLIGSTPDLEMTFNSQLTTSCQFFVAEIDKFLQKNYTSYRGYVQLFRRAGDVDKAVLLSEHVVSIPKETDAETVRISRAPVVIKNWQDPVNQDWLADLANDLGEEWQSLAHHLNVRKVRIQAILRENKEDSTSVKHQMLLNWAKKVPRGVSKGQILKNALIACGRDDLAGRVDDSSDSFKRSRTNSSL